MKYIYESPDKGKTVYRTPMGVPNAKRELITDDDFFVDITDEGMVLLECGNGYVGDIINTEGVKKQLEFIEWLKSKGMYNHMESAHTMQQMHRVWKTLKEES